MCSGEHDVIREPNPFVLGRSWSHRFPWLAAMPTSKPYNYQTTRTMQVGVGESAIPITKPYKIRRKTDDHVDHDGHDDHDDNSGFVLGMFAGIK